MRRPRQFIGKQNRETSSLHLSGGPLRDFRHDEQSSGYFEGGQTLGCKPEDLIHAELRSLEHHRGGDILAKHGMRNPEGCGIFDIGMAAQHLVDLQRRDFLATTIYDFLNAAGQKQITVAVQIALISGPVPIVEESIHVVAGIRFITAEDAGSPHHDLAELANWERFTRLVDDPYLGPDTDAYRSAFAYGRGDRIDRNPSAFRGSIGVPKISAEYSFESGSVVLIVRASAREQGSEAEISCVTTVTLDFGEQ